MVTVADMKRLKIAKRKLSAIEEMEQIIRSGKKITAERGHELAQKYAVSKSFILEAVKALLN